MRRATPLLLLFVAARAGAQTAQPPPVVQPALTLEAALRNAEANQPDVRVARGQELAADAQVDEARAPLFPQVGASAGYNLFAGEAGGLTSPDDSLHAGIDVSLLIWDFGQVSRRWRAAQASARSAEHETSRAALDARRQVRLAFFDARAARELVGVTREALANEQRHLEQISAFVEVGTRPEIDLMQARTAVANAKVALIRAENDYAAAKSDLNLAMGVEGTTAYDVADDAMPPVDGEGSSAPRLLPEALEARPEIAALAFDRRAQELQLDAARAAYWPTLRAGGGVDVDLLADAAGADAPTWAWSAGLTLSWTIFDGFAIRSRVRQARAGIIVLDARVDGQRQAVLGELEQALLAVSSSKAELEASEEALAAARKRLELAEGRYTEGVGNAIELGDAQVEVTRAAAQLVQARVGLSTSRAELIHSLGRR